VQTEHVTGGNRQEVVSHIFFAGAVVSTRRSLCGEGPAPTSDDSIRRAVRHQHQHLIRDLKAGQFDNRIAATPGTSTFRPLTTNAYEAVAAARPGRGSSSEEHSAYDAFARGLGLLQEVLNSWQLAATLAPNNPAFKAAVKMVGRLISVIRPSHRGDKPHGTPKADSAPPPRQTDPPLVTNPRRRFSAGDEEGTVTETETTAPSEPARPLQTSRTGPLRPFGTSQYRAAESFERGQAALQAGNRNTALACWEAAVRADPTNRRYRAGLRKLKRMMAR